MKKTIFLDRDGTINDDRNAEYISKVEDFTFLPGSIEALKLLQDSGFQLIIITNQSGIGRKYYTEEDYQRLTKYMLHELEKDEIKIKAIYYCSHSPESKCACRKPNPLMIEKAVNEHNVDISNSYMIGDKTSDITMGVEAKKVFGDKCKIKTILVQTGKAGKDGRYPNAKPDHIAENLLAAAKWITTP